MNMFLYNKLLTLKPLLIYNSNSSFEVIRLKWFNTHPSGFYTLKPELDGDYYTVAVEKLNVLFLFVQIHFVFSPFQWVYVWKIIFLKSDAVVRDTVGCCQGHSFLVFFLSIRLLSVLRGHSFFLSPPQRPMTSDFEGFPIPDFIHYIYFPS